MSAYIVERAHIDFLIDAAMMAQPRQSGSPVRWYHPAIDDEEMSTILDEQGFEAYCVAAQERTHELRYHDCTEQADRVGRMLWWENLRSVAYRYPDDCDIGDEDAAGWPGPAGFTVYECETYTHRSRLFHLNPVHVLSAIKGYEYQSCEHPDWKTSEARAFCEELRETMIRLLPGYDEAPWEITEAYFSTAA